MHRKLLGLDSREVERILRRYGFTLDRAVRSHQQFFGVVREKKRRVTVIKNQKRYAPKTLATMIRQSGLTEQEWLGALTYKEVMLISRVRRWQLSNKMLSESPKP